MKRLGTVVAAAALLGAACSLIVQFDPEGQPCGAAPNPCLSGYACVGGVCTKNGGNLCSGVVCNTPGLCQHPDGTCNPSTGKCEYPPLAFNSVCTDGSQCTTGDHCDGDGGCVGTSTRVCNTPPSACHSDAGTCNAQSGICEYAALALNDRCEDGNPCTVGDTCGAGGVCSGGSARVCNTPPSACAAANGSCDTIRGCVYPPAPGVTICNDGNNCTQNDFCDAGSCIPGPTCPAPLPCQVGVCQNNSCNFTQAADGTSCGSNASNRCCGGNCVDISTNTNHCGGCNIGCGLGFTCESVAFSCVAPFNPANTSGRCTCDTAMAGSCPQAQNCRGTTPGVNRCQPLDAGQCAPNAKVQTITGCPSYCYY